MMDARPYTEVISRLRAANLRPTRQRIALAKLLFGGCDRHVTAESLHTEAIGALIKVSLATVYNTLHQFTNAGLLREIVVNCNRCYFDTNIFSMRTPTAWRTSRTTISLSQNCPPSLSARVFSVLMSW